MNYIEKKMLQVFNPVKWNPDCLNYEFCSEKMKEGVDNKFMLTIANRSTISGLIKDISDCAY